MTTANKLYDSSDGYGLIKGTVSSIAIGQRRARFDCRDEYGKLNLPSVAMTLGPTMVALKAPGSRDVTMTHGQSGLFSFPQCSPRFHLRMPLNHAGPCRCLSPLPAPPSGHPCSINGKESELPKNEATKTVTTMLLIMMRRL